MIRGESMKKIFAITIVMVLSLVIVGCNNFDSNIKKVNASKINTYYTNDFIKEGAYRIEAKGQSAVVIVAPQDSVKSFSAKEDKKDIIFSYSTKNSKSKTLSIYKYCYIYKNTDKIDTVKIYKNGKESYFESCHVGDEEILN